MLQASTKGSYHNLSALLAGEGESGGSGSLHRNRLNSKTQPTAVPEQKAARLFIVSNHLPLRVKRGEAGWEFEWDEDALVAQAKEGIQQDPPLDVMFVGCLPVDIEVEDQESLAAELKRMYRCCPVYLDSSLKERYYRGFCKQQLWPLFHYILPVPPSSSGRFDPELWQAYVKANKCFADKIVEESTGDADFVWIHDYHLLVLPSLLRKRFNRIRAGIFLHCPFPSSEIFRTFPKREELLRSLLNADLIGFHTFDYARHFLSCCSRMLGLEHETSRGTITLDYYGRSVGIKIMPTGVNPQRYLSGFSWDEFKWRRGELKAQFKGKTVLIAVDDMDIFKGIELKLSAYEMLLDHNPDLRGKIVLVQITNPPRSSGLDVLELHKAVSNLVERINTKYGKPSDAYMPVQYLERHVPLHERMAFYSVADCAVVTATRDGMNLVPYEYIVCRQGPEGDDGGHEAAAAALAAAAAARGGATSTPGEGPATLASADGGSGPEAETLKGVETSTSSYQEQHQEEGSDAEGRSGGSHPGLVRDSMLVVSEFVGCSPSLSGAIRVNPWSIESVSDGIYAAVRMPKSHRQLRHEKHWRYVSQHTVAYWASSFVTDLQRMTKDHVAMRCYGLGLGLDTFRMVALDANFCKLEESSVTASYTSSRSRVFFLDYDGTLTLPAQQTTISLAPDEQVLSLLRALTADQRNKVVLLSGRPKSDLTKWFASVPSLGLVAENGFWLRPISASAKLGESGNQEQPGPISREEEGVLGTPSSSRSVDKREHLGYHPPGVADGWESVMPHADFTWKRIALPILKLYQESTDGSSIECKESALVWCYKDADPDFGSWQAKELMDHLEGVLSNQPVEIVRCNQTVEIKPQGVSKGQAVERLIQSLASTSVLHPRSMSGAQKPTSSRARDEGRRQEQLPSSLVAEEDSSLAMDSSQLGAPGSGPEFVLCIGDDRSDEDMFTKLESMRSSPSMMGSEVFASTVGQKPSRAPFYLNDPLEVRDLLSSLIAINSADSSLA